jgi:branched-chain amino acid transport system ATP-binding protein
MTGSESIAKPPPAAPPDRNLLVVGGLDAWYGDAHILHGVSFTVPEGEVVTLLGRNGAGKTTTLKSIMGLVRCTGSVVFDGQPIAGLPPFRIAGLGVAYCPEERGIFSSLTVAENLELPPVVRAGGLPEGEILALFPNLAERLHRRGNELSGGEQQMLAMARILRTGARFMLLDEPTEGLAPVVIQGIGRTLRQLKAMGFTILLVEQNLRFASSVADRYYVLDHGRVAEMIPAAELEARRDRIQAYLGV